MVALGACLGSVAQHLREGLVVFLHGDLGMGKTTLVRGFIRQMGYQGAVRSPTYTLVETYHFGNARQVNHFDLYRLTHPEELVFLGMRDYLVKASFNFIEWPEKGTGLLPQEDMGITITSTSTRTGRHLHLQAHTSVGSKILCAWQKANSNE